MRVYIYYRFALNSVCSLWLCKECCGKCVQDISPLISNDVNTLVSEMFISKKMSWSGHCVGNFMFYLIFIN